MATRLQISQQDRLKIIQNRIYQYGIQKPVAEISHNIPANPGNVSKMLGGKKPISDNFFKKFNSIYPEKDNNMDNNPSDTQTAFLKGDIKITVQDYIDGLKEDKKKAFEREDKIMNQLASNLTAMMQLLTSLQRHDQVFHETILRSLGRLEGGNTDLVLEARSTEAAKQVQDSLQGSNVESGT